MGRLHFGYTITVCARAERDCPTVFPGSGLKLSWLFDDPRGPEVPEEERLEKFREVRNRIEAKILRWLERPEEELAKLKAERDRERRERQQRSRVEARSYGANEEITTAPGGLGPSGGPTHVLAGLARS